MPGNRLFYGFLLAVAVLAGPACKKYLPDDLDYLSEKAVFTTTLYQPVLGRTTFYSNVFNAGQSSLPLNFKIVNMRTRAGNAVDLADSSVEVLVWKKGYTGLEKTLEEITQKRKPEKHPLWEIRPHSGEFVIWAEATNQQMVSQPDSGYFFDVDVSNSGGRRVFKNLILKPLSQRAYEPNQFDPVTGQVKKDNNGNILHINPTVNNITGDLTGKALTADQVRVYFRKKGEGNSLSFQFLDKDSLPIDPAKFNRTVLDSVVHGFNVKKTATSLAFDVAYPIPLIRLKTRYTNNDGSQAAVAFTYDRLGLGGIRSTSSLSFNFRIFEKGDWEIVFHFYKDNPRFRDE
ncbi:DUF5007 domain-containing protein [Chitinophaga lutea]|uniref:DUF5007 domain-containing protein n=1 Tax=Chitinophaga lutea TaxID=2488634 RepID=A0A3N4PT39_9BACT|nr:DUF5007 domain-containing protein [Chitinophaga lutea]RPE11993.1 DUF5007 domain-containing protein [Chitinophaga lutea]